MRCGEDGVGVRADAGRGSGAGECRRRREVETSELDQGLLGLVDNRVGAPGVHAAQSEHEPQCEHDVLIDWLHVISAGGQRDNQPSERDDDER